MKKLLDKTPASLTLTSITAFSSKATPLTSLKKYLRISKDTTSVCAMRNQTIWRMKMRRTWGILEMMSISDRM